MTEVVALVAPPPCRLGRGWLTASAPMCGRSPPESVTARSSPSRVAVSCSATRPRERERAITFPEDTAYPSRQGSIDRSAATMARVAGERLSV